MIKQMFPKMLMMVLFFTTIFFYSYTRADVPAKQAHNNQAKAKALKAVSFRVVSNKDSERVFNAWSVYAVLKNYPSSNAGGGC